MVVGRRERPTRSARAMTDQQWYWVTYAGDALQAWSPVRPAIDSGITPRGRISASGAMEEVIRSVGSDIAPRPLVSGYMVSGYLSGYCR
jgi:hypothetical protein